MATRQVEVGFGTTGGAQTVAAVGSTSTRPAGAGVETSSMGSRSDLDPILHPQL